MSVISITHFNRSDYCVRKQRACLELCSCTKTILLCPSCAVATASVSLLVVAC